MSKTITFNCRKGGTGRSSDIAHLTEILSERGLKILVIDMDNQGNVSDILGADQSGNTVADVLSGDVTIEDAIQHIGAYDVLPANINLALTEAEMKEDGKEFVLKNVLDKVKDQYDLILIDNSPNIGTLAFNSLVASDYVIMAVQADMFSLQGASSLKDSIDLVKKIVNPDLEILGVIINRFDGRSNFSRQIGEFAEQFAQDLGTTLFNTKIRECVKVKEAQLVKEPLIKYAPRSNAAIDFTALADEILERINK